MATKKFEMTPDLKKVIDGYLDAEKHIKEAQAYKDQCMDYIMQAISNKDITSDFEGTESLECDDIKVSFTYKLTRSYDEGELVLACEEAGVPIEKVANIKYNYSATLSKELDPNIRHTIEEAALTTKRAKTALKITVKEAK